MVDNTDLNAMSGGDKIQTEDMGGSLGKIQRIKLVLGNAGDDDGDVSEDNKMPVVGYVTPDGGSTFYPLFGNTSGIPSVNANNQASNEVIGAVMTYQEAVGRQIAPGAIRKVLKAVSALSSSGNTTLSSWTDQDGNTYTAVPAGKTLYISRIVITLKMPNATTHNAATFTFGNTTNRPVAADVSSAVPVVIPLEGIFSVASGQTPSALFGSAFSADEASVTLVGWEE